MAHFLLQNVTWHRNCVGSNAFPESQVYWAQGAEQAQQQITCSLVTAARSKCAFPRQLMATAACPAVASLKRGHRPDNLVWFVNLLPAAVVLCLHCLLGGSWGTRERHFRAGRLSWQVLCQLCCGDLCCSLAAEIQWHPWVYRWCRMVATTDNCMSRFRSARLGRRKTSKKKSLMFCIQLHPFYFFPLFCAICLYAISTCQ